VSDIDDLVSGIDSVLESLRNCVAAMLANEQIATDLVASAKELGVPTTGVSKAAWDTGFFRGMIEGVIDNGVELVGHWKKVGGTREQ